MIELERKVAELDNAWGVDQWQQEKSAVVSGYAKCLGAASGACPYSDDDLDISS